MSRIRLNLARRWAAIAVVTLVSLVQMLIFPIAPSLAIPTGDSASSQEKIDRAYDIRLGTGMEEEILQQRLQEGADPEKLAKPFTHVPDITGKKEVPETSGLETLTSRARELVKKVTPD